MSITVCGQVSGLDYGLSGNGETLEKAQEDFRERVLLEIRKQELIIKDLQELLA